MKSFVKTKFIAPDTADDDGIAASQKPAAGDEQTLTIAGVYASAGVATLDVPRRVTITSDGDDSGRTFIVTGTDEFGNAIAETIDGPNSTTVTSMNYFATVTEVAIDDDSTGNLTVGTGSAVKAPISTASRVHVMGVHYVCGSAAGTPLLRDGLGTIAVQWGTVASATVLDQLCFDGLGLRLKNGAYAEFDQTKLTSLTVIYQG